MCAFVFLFIKKSSKQYICIKNSTVLRNYHPPEKQHPCPNQVHVSHLSCMSLSVGQSSVDKLFFLFYGLHSLENKSNCKERKKLRNLDY